MSTAVNAAEMAWSAEEIRERVRAAGATRRPVASQIVSTSSPAG